VIYGTDLTLREREYEREKESFGNINIIRWAHAIMLANMLDTHRKKENSPWH
jgi:hypothetical protein